MKLLVLGKNSQLGHALTDLLGSQDVEFISAAGSVINNINQSELIKIISKETPTQVINVSSFGNLASVEEDAALASRCDEINTEGLSMLAEVCAKMELPLLHHSSSLVFDGKKLQPYNEEDIAEPQNRYGLSKWYGERSIRETLPEHVIVRTDWLFGPSRKTYFQKFIENCKLNNGRIEVMHHRFCPTPAIDVARVLLAIARQVDCNVSVWGTYHYCALQAVNQEQFVESFLQLAAEKDKHLAEMLDKLEFVLLDVAPPYIANTALDCAKIMATFGIKQRPRGDAVTAMIDSLYP